MVCLIHILQWFSIAFRKACLLLFTRSFIIRPLPIFSSNLISTPYFIAFWIQKISFIVYNIILYSFYIYIYFIYWRRKWQPTPVFLPGESQGRTSLVAAVYGVAQSRTQLKRLLHLYLLYICSPLKKWEQLSYSSFIPFLIQVSVYKALLPWYIPWSLVHHSFYYILLFQDLSHFVW